MTRTLLIAACLAAATAATAAPTSLPAPAALTTLQPQGGPDNFTVSFGNTLTKAGTFVDHYFIEFSGPATVNAQLVAVFQPGQESLHQVVFDAVDLHDSDLTLSTQHVAGQEPLVMNFAHSDAISTAGGFKLKVKGCAGDCTNKGAKVSGNVAATYTGTVNLRLVAAPANAVPEPASLALTLAALGAAGLARRRR